MKARNVLLVTITMAALATATAAVWAEITADDVKKIAVVLRPYQVLSGQTSTDYEVLFVLDNEARKLAVLKYTPQDQLVAIAGRDLSKDFGGEAGGPYSMVTTQLTTQRGLLYVTDAATHRALVYKVDLINNKFTPQQPVELKKLFNE